MTSIAAQQVMAVAQSQQLSGLAGWTVHVMDALGGPGAGAVVALENLFPPIPSEVILPPAGYRRR